MAVPSPVQMPHARGRPPWPVVVAVVVLVAGMAWAWMGWPLFSQPVEEVCVGWGVWEGTSTHTELSLWPPGAVDCQFTTPDGSIRESTYMPWRDYLAVALLAAAVGAACMALTRRARRRASWLAGACLLAIASYLALFLGWSWLGL